jgi:hypothetical protein
VENSCELGNEPSVPLNAGKLLNGCTAGSLSSSAWVHRFS